MKKNIKYFVLLLILTLIPVINVKADYFDTRSGYDCYLMCQDASCTYKFLFYTNRDMSGITGYNGTTARTNVFSEGSDGTIISLYQNNSSTIAGMAVHSFIEEAGLENAQVGNISPMQCAAAGAVFTATGGSSEPYELIIEESSSQSGAYEGPGVFEVLPNVLLFGYDFTRITPSEDVVNSDAPYDFAYGDALGIAFGYDMYPNSENALAANSCNYDYWSIDTEEKFINCYQCTGTSSQLQESGSTCNNGMYTIGVMPEPDNVTSEIDDGTDPNDVTDGTIISSIDSSTSTYNWTCDDVKYSTFAYNTLRIIAPFLLIIYASIDYFKAVAAGDVKKQAEARSKAPKRLIAFLLLLLLPFVVGWLFKTFGGHGSGVMTAFCCVATNGNQQCTIENPNQNEGGGGNNGDGVTAENLCNGNSYLTPSTHTTVTSVAGCINDRKGECQRINVSDGTCTCKYSSVEVSEELCNSNCGVGYYSGKCYFNVRTGQSTSKINNMANSGLTLIKKVHQSGTTGDYHDGYFQYDMHIKENITQSVCSNELNGTAYSCDSTGNSCSCVYGKSIYD